MPEEIVNPTPEFNADCLAILTHWRKGDLPFNEAIAQLSVMVQRATMQGSSINQARAEQLLANLQLTRGNMQASIQHSQRARILISKHHNPERKAVIDLTEGEGWRFLGVFDKAIALYQSAYTYAQQIDNKSLQTYAIVNTGLVFLSLGRIPEAEKSFLDGLALISHWKDDETSLGPLCEIAHGLATIYLIQNRPQDAWEQTYTVYQLVKHSTDPRYHGMINRTMGEVITAMTPIADSNLSTNPDDYFRTSLAYFNELNAEAEALRTIYAQAKSLAMRGNPHSALRKLQQIIIRFEKLNMADDLQNALTLRKTLLA